jgi:DNA-binding LacI/PurR family transcriptional regulator
VYVGEGAGPESHADRFRGFTAAVAEAGADGLHLAMGDGVLDTVIEQKRTCVFVEEYADGVALARAAEARGVRVPEDLSFVALGDPTRPAATDIDFTGFRIPRREMGWQAVEVLSEVLEGGGARRQRLLPCEPVAGATLAVAGA